MAPEISELEDLAARSNVQMAKALARAGVALSTYWRWRHEGREPLTGTVRKVRAAITELANAA